MGSVRKDAKRVWWSNEDYAKMQDEVYKGFDKAYSVEKKLGRIDRGKYVEESLGRKLAQGHRLAKLEEMEETPRVVGPQATIRGP